MTTPNDKVMTPVNLSKAIVAYFKPSGHILEPCRGTGNFFKSFPSDCTKSWCEIDDGVDFFDWKNPVDWIITNPPYSIYDKFLSHAFEVASDVVFLCPLQKAWKSQKMNTVIEKFGGLKEVVFVAGGRKIGFPFGFPVGCLHYQRGYDANLIKFTKALPGYEVNV